MDQRPHRDTPMQRRLALATDAELRTAVSLLLEQCEKEADSPPEAYAPVSGPYLHVSEVFYLLGLGTRKPVTRT